MPLTLDPNMLSYLIEANCQANNESEVFDILVDVFEKNKRKLYFNHRPI